MSGLAGLAPLSITGIGSLPFVSPADAVRHATRAYDIPFCPQLATRDGDRVRPASWSTFVDELIARPPESRVVKVQVRGAVTSASAAAATAQIERLRELGFDVLLFADERALADTAVCDSLRQTGAAAWGVHVCGRVPWQLVRAAAPQIVSFDVVRHQLDDEARSTLDSLLAAGSRIAWGIVDPADPGSAPAAAARASACLSELAVGRSVADVAARSMLTPSCGTGRLSATREKLVAAILGAAAMATQGAVSASSPPETRADVR